MDTSLFRLQLLDLFNHDREAGKMFWKVSRGRVAAGQEAGKIDSKGYRRVRIDGKDYQVHRLIFLIEHGYLPDYIDHRDGNPLNNRIENLRPCSHRQNMRNKSKHSNNTSGVTGVSFHRPSGKWLARCRDRTGKQTHLGYFTDIQVAAEVVKAFRLKHHGEFAIDHREAV